MREALYRHFDLVVVIWVLALSVCWMMVILGRADLSGSQWGVSGSGPVWMASGIPH